MWHHRKIPAACCALELGQCVEGRLGRDSPALFPVGHRVPTPECFWKPELRTNGRGSRKRPALGVERPRASSSAQPGDGGRERAPARWDGAEAALEGPFTWSEPARGQERLRTKCPLFSPPLALILRGAYPGPGQCLFPEPSAGEERLAGGPRRRAVPP